MRYNAVTITLSITFAVAALAGCGTLPEVTGGEEAKVEHTIGLWKNALEAGELDRLMTAYSDDYVSTRGGGKEEVRAAMGELMREGGVENLRVVLDNAKVAVQDGEARYGTVLVVVGDRKLFLAFMLQKDPDGQWRLIRTHGG